MSRRAWILVGAAILLGGGAMALFRPQAEDSLAAQVPSDAVLYADLRGLDALAAFVSLPELDDARRKLEEARPHLAGPVAVYLDRELEWVFLARLTRTSAALSGGEVENGAALFAQTPGALARHRARTTPLSRVPAFRELRTSLFLNLESLALGGRWADFSAVGFEPGPDGVVRGRALYRGEVFRTYLERYVQAPLAAGTPTGPVGATFVEPLPRVWNEVLSALAPRDRELAEREASLLSRDFLEGRGIRDFLARLGPAGVTARPGPDGFPALAFWLDLPGADERSRLERLLPRLAHDVAKYRRDRGLVPPFEVAPEGDRWRVRVPEEAELKKGEAFAPVYAFRGDRWMLASCAAALDLAPAGAGTGHHVALTVDLEAAFAMLRARKVDVASWEKRLARLSRVDATGRYTGSGLEFEARLTGR
jgi:hypothetical protein